MPQQVFISYSHVDDQPYGPKAQRWVQTFEQALTETLTQRVGRGRIALWRDKRRMDGATLFDELIQIELRKSDVLITVLSQGYLDSDYCRDELVWFGRDRLAHGGLQAGQRSRIVKVYRAAVDRAELRHRFDATPELAGFFDSTEGFKLFCVEGDIDRDALLHPDGMALVWQRADDLAITLKRIIDDGLSEARVPAAPGGPVVYLARTASDMANTRDLIRRELEDRQCLVLPAGDPPQDAADHADAVRRDLASAQLSIHLLGQRYGSIPEGSQESGVALQVRLALQAAHAPFTTLLWTPEGSAPPEAPLAALLEDLSAHWTHPPARAERLHGTQDLLKAQTIARLGSLAAAAATPVPAAAAADQAKLVYLICDAVDHEHTKALKQALETLGFEVTRPLREGTPDEILDEHKRCLVACDVAVILWGSVREPWVRAKLRDLQQSVGWGRASPPRVRLVLVGPPDSDSKRDFDVPAGVKVLAATELSALGPLLT
ncbi:TIR domain-containing protein [Aquincola sp. S2]|uniref:TIR domain-containing protein n=1 Tax=Pseudaquabacterium terrae TaxID=2732868 RepID=A0ABX2ET50_9BURK|nr:DUF4062 domain-containing protein [Aquabacterium terrae]NRF71811.1 TIR domain-containing protein [Aquabacterium terrae]